MRMPADQRRQQLFDVARERFSQQGFHATSMDEIAEAAGVTKPVLYQHFPSKRALYVELLEDTGRQLLTALAEATGRAGSGRERVELGFRAYFNFAVNNLLHPPLERHHVDELPSRPTLRRCMGTVTACR